MKTNTETSLTSASSAAPGNARSSTTAATAQVTSAVATHASAAAAAAAARTSASAAADHATETAASSSAAVADNLSEPIDPASCELRMDGDNSYPDCACCGQCCGINVLAITEQELARMLAVVEERHITPINRGKDRCCLQSPDGTCMIWDARPQVCRLYNCHVPRKTIVAEHPELDIPENPPLVDLYDAFFCGDYSDPRYRIAEN